MSVITQHAFAHNEYRAPIRFSGHSEKELHEREIINCCVDSMTFLADFVETCQLCDKTIHHHYEKDGANLCEDCHDRIKSLSDCRTKECIVRFLIGNVL